MDAALFGLPLRMSQISPTTKPTARKRKRADDQKEHDDGELANTTNVSSAENVHAPPIEYSAVVSPQERHQRRVAGIDIDREPPSYPFPHKAEVRSSPDRRLSDHSNQATVSKSFRLQHLAAMMSILHQSVMRKDFRRANRALSILLREEIKGQDFDIRSQDVWGIGAEVLLRRGGHISDTVQAPPTTMAPNILFTQRGWADAKTFLEALMIKHPYNKSFPESVNSLNFCVVLYSLWIYTAHQESLNAQENETLAAEVPGHQLALQAKELELRKAQDILADMDGRMGRLPYHDDADLIRLHEQVSRWIADLEDDIKPHEEREHVSK